MKTFSKTSAFILSFMMVFTMMPMLPLSMGTVHAADNIGEITVDGNTTTYNDYRKLKQALEKLKNKEITVEMLTDWDDSLSDMKVGERLKIPDAFLQLFECLHSLCSCHHIPFLRSPQSSCGICGISE